MTDPGGLPARAGDGGERRWDRRCCCCCCCVLLAATTAAVTPAPTATAVTMPAVVAKNAPPAAPRPRPPRPRPPRRHRAAPAPPHLRAATRAPAAPAARRRPAAAAAAALVETVTPVATIAPATRAIRGLVPRAWCRSARRSRRRSCRREGRSNLNSPALVRGRVSPTSWPLSTLRRRTVIDGEGLAFDHRGPGDLTDALRARRKQQGLATDDHGHGQEGRNAALQSDHKISHPDTLHQPRR